MPVGLIGKKVGMTRVFTEDNVSVPVTVVHAPANYVTQVKTPERDGYLALQLAGNECKASRLTKAMIGHFKKSGTAAHRSVHEFRIDETERRESGAQVKVTSFSVGEKVDVTGTSKGKGFAGTIKRHHFRSQDATHGNSLSHRAAGSIGQCQTPGRVFKGKKMAGHLGSERVTVKNLTVVQVDAERELLLIGGAVPGARGSEVLVRHLVAVPPAQETDEKPVGEVPPEAAETATPAVAESDSAAADAASADSAHASEATQRSGA